jgi:hypothetical protein
MRQLSTRSSFLVSLGILAVTIASRFAYNGLVFGFDYGLFHPDGSLYAFKTLTLMGYSQHDAAIQVSNWYADHAYKLQSIDPKSLYFEMNPSWAIYGTRLAYPILSIPFVGLFGMYGLLVVPSLSFLVLVIGIVIMGKHFNNPWAALAVVFALTVSPTVGRWMLINSTDSLLVALTMVLTLIVLKNVRSPYWYPLTCIIVIVGSYTRFSLFLWLGYAIGLAFARKYLRAFVLSIVAIASFLPTLFLDFQSAVLPNEGNSSLFVKVIKLPFSMLRMAFYDVAQLVVLDRVLLFVILGAVILSFKHLKKSVSRYFLSVLLMLWCTAGINGTPGVNFRYELPILPLLSWVLIENIKSSKTSRDAETEI